MVKYFYIQHPYPIFMRMRDLEKRANEINRLCRNKRLSDDQIDCIYYEITNIQSEFENLFCILKSYLN